MRVALIAPLFESVPPRMYGGTERVVYNLCRGLTERDIEVTLFGSGDSCIEGEVVGITREALRLSQVPIQDPLPYSFKMMAAVADRAEEFDLIHNHNDYWMLPLTRMTSVPVLTTFHGRLDLPDLPAALEAYKDSSFVAISNSQRRRLQAVRWDSTVYNGVDTDSYEFHDRPGGYLAFLGRISSEKRPEWAIEIAKQSGIPLKIAAKIEGKAGREYFDSRVKPHLDGKLIEYVGEISEGEKSDFLGNALGLLFPIDWPEPFGLVLVEALACGTPVLARPCGSVPEILRDGITGFSDMSLSQLARKAPELARLDRGACRKWAVDHFSLGRMTEEYLDVYRSIIDSNRAGAGRHRRNFLHSVQRPPDRNREGQSQG